MSNAAHLLDPRVRAASAVFVDPRAGRHAARSHEAVLDALSQPAFAEVVRIIRAVLAAADAAENHALVEQPPARMSRAYVDLLRTDLGDASLALFIRDRASVPSAAFSATSAETHFAFGDEAQAFWDAVTECARQQARQVPSDSQEPSA